MRNPFRLFSDLLHQPIWIPIWVFALMIVNFASIGFWSEPLAKLIVGIFVISAMLMMALYSRFGFEKLLGLGHLPWIPLSIYMLSRLPNTNGAFRSNLILLSICIVISLVYDVIDAWNYFTVRRSASQDTKLGHSASQAAARGGLSPSRSRRRTSMRS